MTATAHPSSRENTRAGAAPVRALLVGATLIAVLAAASFLLRTGPWTEEALPELWSAPAFSLVDQQGRPFGSEDLKGRAAVYSFVYTNCPDTCPLLTAAMAQVQGKLRAEGLLGSKVQLASITVDPHRDTPAVLTEYAGRFKADPDAWRFLSGQPEAIYEVLWGFKLNTVEVARASAGADVIPHSNRFVVVDPRGLVRAQLLGPDIPPEDIVRTVRRVLS